MENNKRSKILGYSPLKGHTGYVSPKLHNAILTFLD